MKKMPALFIKILELLSSRFSSSFSLEELTNLMLPEANMSGIYDQSVYMESRKQATVLDALMQMHNEGLIFLNCITDESFITLKGLAKIDSKVYCN